MFPSDRWAFAEIGPEHFGFQRERVLWPSDIGEPTHRWIPFGMPALRQEMSDCVFYLYRRNPKTGKVEDKPVGTGTVIAHYSRRYHRNRFMDPPATEPDVMVHYYGVTNWHLTNQAGASIIRVNVRNGTSRYLEYDPADWQFIPNTDDLSAIDLTDDLLLPTDQVAAYPEYLFVTEKVINKLKIRIGENALMVGMFRSHPGERQNHPVAKFGNVSFLANKDSLIRQPNKMARPSHLVDMRSRSGFSGSPVSVWRTPADALLNPGHDKWDARFDQALDDTRAGYGQELYIATSTLFIGLLGIHCGQFWDPVKAYKSPPIEERDGDPIHEGDQLYIQSGMTIVVPAWRISELLALETFKMAREKRDAKRREEFTRTTPAPEVAIEADAVSTNDDSPAADANPNHLKDFARLVDVAARKKPKT
jgi:hypothetical protein